MKSIWAGTIQFGLVHIPVKIFPATRERRIDLNFISKKNHCPIANVRVCKDTGEQVPFEQIVRGYEYEEGAFIEVDEKDLKNASTNGTESIQIIDFVPRNEIRCKYFEKPYYVAADKEEKGYKILQEALRRSGTAAVVKYVLKTQENLGVITIENGILILNQIRFYTQIQPHTPHIPTGKENISEEEIQTALELIGELTVHFSPEKYQDTFNNRLKEIIRNKIQGIQTPKSSQKTTPTNASQVENYLRRSLEYAQKGLLSQ